MKRQLLEQKNGGCCGPLVLLILVVVVLFSVVFVAPQTPTDKPAPHWYQVIENVVSHSGQQVQHIFDTVTSKRAQRGSVKTSHLASPSGSCFDLARAAATQAGIDPTLYARQINQESGCQVIPCSSAGACGVAQLMPEMAASLGVDPTNMQQSLQAGAHLMAGYLKMYNGSWALALACYNAGSGRVKEALTDYGANWYASMPAETQHYITAILGNEAQA
jgi:soluble lytic murein transglycosylase-like protein